MALSSVFSRQRDAAAKVESRISCKHGCGESFYEGELITRDYDGCAVVEDRLREARLDAGQAPRTKCRFVCKNRVVHGDA